MWPVEKKTFQIGVQEHQWTKGTVHDTEQEATNCNQIDMVNINSISFNSKQLVMVVNLKTSSNQNSTVIPYKIDTGSDGNIMPFHITKLYFLW